MEEMMKTKEFIANNLGKDKIVGRPIRLNTVRLEPKRGKDYAEILFWGDVHLGHKQCLEDKAKAMLDYALKNNMYVILMGDLIEAGLRDSIGDSVYYQSLNPQEQMERAIEMLEPIAKTGRIIGLHQGN